MDVVPNEMQDGRLSQSRPHVYVCHWAYIHHVIGANRPVEVGTTGATVTASLVRHEARPGPYPPSLLEYDLIVS